MGFRTGAFCKIWDVTPVSDRKTKLRVSISMKNKEGEYVQEFSDFPVCLGSACASKAARLKKGDVIKLGDVDVSNRYDKEKRITYYDFKIFSFEPANHDGGSSMPSGRANTKPVDELEPDPTEDPLPF
jgi:hypothetical protein